MSTWPLEPKGREAEARTVSPIPFKYTRFVSLLILDTSKILSLSSPRTRTWSPGTMFQYFMRSLTLAALMFWSAKLNRFSQCRGKDCRWRKSFVHGRAVVAVRTCRVDQDISNRSEDDLC